MALLTESALKSLRDLDSARRSLDNILRKVNKIHSKLAVTSLEKAEKLKSELWEKLQGFYMDAKARAEEEERLAAVAMREVETLVRASNGVQHSLPRSKSDVGEHHKRKRLKADEAEPSQPVLRLASPSPTASPHIPAALACFDPANLVPGCQVAGRVSRPDSEADDWLLLKVVECHHDLGRYTAIDEDPGEEDDGKPKRFTLGRSCVIPLLKPTDTAHVPEFPPGSYVLAMFPGTTAFYRALVVGGPRKRKTDVYFLEFDDDEEEGVPGIPQRQVPFHHVLPFADSGHRK